MSSDSLMQLVRYQRNIGAVPPGGGFSVRTYWAAPLRAKTLGGSLRKYNTSYKGVTTYTKLNGFQTVNDIRRGLLPDILNGAQANTPPLTDGATIQPLLFLFPAGSRFWSAIMSAIISAYNKLQGKSATVAMDWFKISSPASDVANLSDGIKLVARLLSELSTTNSVTVSGQFRLVIQHAIDFNPFGWLDPKPVFDWSFTISFDSKTCSITLTIDITYDHMESDGALATLMAAFLGLITGGLFLGGAGELIGLGAGIAVGQSVTQTINSKANSAILNFLAGSCSQITWIHQPIEVTVSCPTNNGFVVSVPYQLDATTCNEIGTFFGDLSLVSQLFTDLGLGS